MPSQKQVRRSALIGVVAILVVFLSAPTASAQNSSWDQAIAALRDDGFTLVTHGQPEAFAFRYKEGGRKGVIHAAIAPGQEAGTWDLECVLEEEAAER